MEYNERYEIFRVGVVIALYNMQEILNMIQNLGVTNALLKGFGLHILWCCLDHLMILVALL